MQDFMQSWRILSFEGKILQKRVKEREKKIRIKRGAILKLRTLVGNEQLESKKLQQAWGRGGGIIKSSTRGMKGSRKHRVGLISSWRRKESGI